MSGQDPATSQALQQTPEITAPQGSVPSGPRKPLTEGGRVALCNAIAYMNLVRGAFEVRNWGQWLKRTETNPEAMAAHEIILKYGLARGCTATTSTLKVTGAYEKLKSS